jgi:meso-butanediol dehydrogenase / (S,S)-butanediol dehydrogenase / diacetyl reductase
MKLKDKVALVTGGGSGIGAAIAKAFVDEGARVCITGRRADRLEKQAAAFPKGFVIGCPGDVSQFEDVERMVAAAVGFGGRIDILVNNAASDVMGPITELSPEDFRKVLEVNLTGPFMLMREAMIHMLRDGGGSVINISSIGGLRCMPGSPAYSASKAGLIHLTRQAALDYGPAKIRCNVVCPGATRTEMLVETVGEMAKDMKMDTEEIFAKFSSHVPLRRISMPAEVAAVCTFLASEDSSFMTGAVLVVDGGATIVDVSGASVT